MRLDVFLCVVRGLHCRSRPFSSCGERGQNFAVVRGRLQAVTSLVAEHKHLSTLCPCVHLSTPKLPTRAPRHTGNTQRGGGGKPWAPSCLGASARLGVWPARTRVSAVGATVRSQHLLTLVHTGAGRESLVRNSPAGRPTQTAALPPPVAVARAHGAGWSPCTRRLRHRPHCRVRVILPAATRARRHPRPGRAGAPPEHPGAHGHQCPSFRVCSCKEPPHRPPTWAPLAAAQGRHPWPIGQHTAEQSGCDSRRGLQGAVTPNGASVPGGLEEQSQNLGKGDTSPRGPVLPHSRARGRGCSLPESILS